MSESTIIKSLSRQEILDYISKYGLDAFLKFVTTGNFIALFGVGSQAFTDYKQRQVFEVQSEAFEAQSEAFKAQSEAFKAFKNHLPKFLKALEEKKINVVPEAFNSSPDFISTFKSAADLYAVPILLYNAIEAIKYIGHALDGIKDELSLSNVAKIQGWENYGFGSHIYRFVRSEMETANQARREGDTRRHYFYVWHPDTSWYQTFRERIRERPLGHNFGGYHSDLPTICMRMACDRATLSRHTNTGRDAVFHLLIPAYEPIIVKEFVIFHPDLFPLVICGQKHRRINFVWFRIRHLRETETPILQDIGELKQSYPDMDYGIEGFRGCWTGGAWSMTGGFVAACVFPPLAPAFFACSLGCIGFGIGSLGATIGARAYLGWDIPAGHRVLGASMQLPTPDQEGED